MSLGWKKFTFFDKEEVFEHCIPDDITCSCSSPALLYVGTLSGEVVTLERQFNETSRVAAHPQGISHICYVKERKVLVTLGRDDSGAAKLKLWSAEDSGRGPSLLRTIDCLGMKHADAGVTELAVHDSHPQLVHALGLSTGYVLVLKADTGKDKVGRVEVSVRPDNSDLWKVTGLGFGGAEFGLQLFVETLGQTLVVDLASTKKSVVDEMGAEVGCTAVSHEEEFVVARPEAVYLYTPDGRGPCFVFDGKKQQVGWTRHYLIAVTQSLTSAVSSTTHSLQAYDLRNKLIATSLPLREEPKKVAVAWGVVMVVQRDGSLVVLKEKPLASKLELLYNKSLYLVALNLAHSEQADAKVVAEIQARYAGHLYNKHDHDGAMQQYLATIGHLEPSFVIRKFLDAQRILNLTAYLEALHSKGLASADHTTLLLNCYTKLKDVEKLDDFLKASGASQDQPALSFDVETAIKVCRSAGYYEHALYVAQASKQPATYLDILVEDCQKWDEALAFLGGEPREESAAALSKYGKVLVTKRPEATTALLMQLCTAGESDADFVAKVAGFTHLYDERPQALMLLCEFVLNSTGPAASEGALYLTLLQLYLAEDNLEDGDANAVPSVSPLARREQALELLKRGWQPGGEPAYDPDDMLVVCRTHAFQEGLMFLYEKLRLFREVLQVHMSRQDYSGLIDACLRLGDASRGGDPQLWTVVLEHLTMQESDVTPQIQEVLGHIEAGNLLPPLLILQILATNPRLKLSLVKEYMTRQLKAENACIEEDQRQIAKYEAETKAMREEVHELRTKARVFQNSKCAVSGAPLELPAVHFLCGHSCNLRSLGENDRECPLCAPHFHTILEIRRSLKAGAFEQDKFFSQLRNSADGFGVIADFFGRGLLNNSASHTSRS